MIREPAGIVSSPPIFSYVAPPTAPSNMGYTNVSVPDPRRGTAVPFYGKFQNFVVNTYLSWLPTFVNPSRKILYASGTDTATAVWPYPGVPAFFQTILVQPSRAVVNPSGTTFTTSLAELVFADKWQPVTSQPNRSVVRGKGTDFVLVRDQTTVDKWLPTTVQPNRSVSRPNGTDFVETLFMNPLNLNEWNLNIPGNLLWN